MNNNVKGDHGAVEALILDLNASSRVVRYNAASSLGKLGDGRAVNGLLAVLRRRDEAEDVVQAAGLALAQLDNRALNVLIEALHNQEENSMLRTYAASAIGEIGSARQVQHRSASAPDQAEVALAALLEATREDFNWQASSVRAGLVQGLGAVGQNRAEPAVLELLNQVLRNVGEDIVVRCEAAWSLGRLDNPTARRELIAAAKLVEQEAGSESLRQTIEVALMPQS